MSSLLSRIHRLWKLSEPIKTKQWTWNGEPVSKEEFDKKMGIGAEVIPNGTAQFIPRIVKDPIKELTEEQP